MALNVLPVTIRAGQSVSDPIDCSGSARIVRLVMPSAWTAAPLTFCMSTDNTNYHDLYHTSSGELKTYEVTVPFVTPDSVVAFPAGSGSVVAWFKIRSGTHAVPVVQPAARTFQVVVEVLDQTTGGGTGIQGPTGPAGIPGPTGSTGTMGSQGAAGAVGPAGPTGVKGATGPAGVASSLGVTDGSNAAPGVIGEVLSVSIPTGQPLTTNVVLNLGSINLTPGDWNIGSVVNFTPNNTGPNGIAAGITLSSGTLPTDTECATGVGIMNQNWTSGMQSNKIQTMPTSLLRVNTATAKTVYLVAMANFGGGAVTVTGYMSARRIR